MKVSVIIPTKNAGKQFENVLETVLNQDTSWAFEVLVIDSGSSDGTVEYIESKTNIRSYQIPAKDFGHGKTRNYGASLANGEFLVFITQDALPYNNNWLKEMVAPFDMSDEIVGVFGRHIAYENCDVFEKHNLEVHFNNFGENIVVYKMEDKEKYKQDEGYKHLLCFYSDNSSAMRKSMWKNIPYDDVDFAEDQLWAKKNNRIRVFKSLQF
jgi:rhamnosyltransferase